jgi:phage baseplate assembly protein W
MQEKRADFVGRGWSFPIRILQSRGKPFREIVPASEDEKVRQAIWLILATAPGERVMRPDFGCGIHELVFAVNDAATLGQAEDSVRSALIRWEPRIDVLDVNAEVRDEGQTLWLNIHYRVRSTNNLFNLVYPFYLPGSFA